MTSADPPVFRFACTFCGDEHEGLPALAFDEPVYTHALPDEEWKRRVVLTSDTCELDGVHFFVRGRLEIPVHGWPEPLSWGVWMSLSREDFQRFVELFEEPGRTAEGGWMGWMSSLLPGYPDTRNLKVRLHLQPLPDRPLFELEPTEHPLAVDQREGIPMARAVEIVARALHPEA